MQNLCISRPPFSGLIWKFILWHATKHPWDSSIDGPFPPAVVLRSNQAATVCLRLSAVLPPGYRLTVLPTAPSDCRPNNDKTRPSDRAVIARLSLLSAVAWSLARLYLAEAELSASPSAVRPPVCSPGSCSTCPIRRSPTLSASPIDRPSPICRYQVASQIPAEMQLRSIVRCSHGLASTSAAAT